MLRSVRTEELRGWFSSRLKIRWLTSIVRCLGIRQEPTYLACQESFELTGYVKNVQNDYQKYVQ